MKTTKEFDCLRMKEEVQEKVRKAWEGLTDEEIRAELRNYLDCSKSELVDWWRRVSLAGTQVSKS